MSVRGGVWEGTRGGSDKNEDNAGEYTTRSCRAVIAITRVGCVLGRHGSRKHLKLKCDRARGRYSLTTPLLVLIVVLILSVQLLSVMAAQRSVSTAQQPPEFVQANQRKVRPFASI